MTAKVCKILYEIVVSRDKTLCREAMEENVLDAIFFNLIIWLEFTIHQRCDYTI